MKRWLSEAEKEAARQAASLDRRSVLTANGHGVDDVARTFLIAFEDLGCSISHSWRVRQDTWHVPPDVDADAFALINALHEPERARVVEVALGRGQPPQDARRRS